MGVLTSSQLLPSIDVLIALSLCYCHMLELHLPYYRDQAPMKSILLRLNIYNAVCLNQMNYVGVFLSTNNAMYCWNTQSFTNICTELLSKPVRSEILFG